MIVLGLLTTVPGLMPPVASALGLTTTGNQVAGWAGLDYAGYQDQTAWPEYHDIMTTMSTIAKRYGCGRAMWEYNSNEGRFGSPEALMLLPYWTNNCVDSEEGLFFESSPTTPYHFLDQAELSVGPSNPQVGPALRPARRAPGRPAPPDARRQVLHRLLAGHGQGGQRRPVALLHRRDEGVARPGVQWRVYLIHDSPVVEPLSTLPNVVVGHLESQGVAQRQRDLVAPAVVLAGPGRRERAGVVAARVLDQEDDQTSRSDPTTVSDVHVKTQSLSFHVSSLGTPVLVKVSYFPRWHVTGAQGPYRVSPDLMVVVPTSHDVSMAYGSTPALTIGNIVTDLTSLAGLVALWVILKRRRITRR